MNRIVKKITLASVAIVAISFIPPVKRKFIDPANMDLSVKPGDNFFLYANGNWVKKNPIPASKTRWGSFGMIAEQNSKRVHELLEDAMTNKSLDAKLKKLGNYFASGMDTVTIEKSGYQPIKADLDRIANLKTVADILNEMVYERTSGVGGEVVGVFIGPDRKNVTKYIPQIGQGGITLPDRDYYLKSDTRNINIRKEFVSNMINLFKLTGVSAEDASKKADAILQLETAIAKAQMARVEMRDPYKVYNKFAWKDLSATTPLLDWKSLAEKLRVTNTDSVVVANPAFLVSINGLLSTVAVDDWKTYLQWHIIENAAPFLSSAFVQQSFKFSQVLSGQKEMTPRWQRVSTVIDNTMGDLLGELYVKKYFTAEAKQRMLDLVNNLQQTFAERIKKLDWMSAETKLRALEKLNAFTKKIGYTDKWRDYSTVNIAANDYLGNRRRTSKWAYDDMISRIGKPVDKTEWRFTPPTVNASYNPSNNDITFPAGILEFPFFDFEADDAVNYGGIGVVIGHEMTHGFDDQGRQFAYDGNLKDWWTKDDADKFKSRANEVVEQYNGFTVLDTMHVNGKLTLGENLADLGGMNIAYEAFTKTKQFKEGKSIDGFTPAQRFFLGFAQVWRENIAPEDAASRIVVDPHSPAVHRVNGPITNMDEWYAAFNIQPTDKMYKPKDKRTKIW